MPIAVLSLLLLVTALPPDEAPEARRAWQRIEASIAALEAELPTLTTAAEWTASALTAGDVFGAHDRLLASEFALKPGAPQWYHGSTTGAVTLHASSHTLAFSRGDETLHVTTTYPIATHAAAWAWQCELFSACTRLSRVPVLRRSPEVDTRHTWLTRYGDQRFHDDRWLEPIPPEALGREYLTQLRATLRDAGTASWRPLADAAWRARDTLHGGGRVFVRATGLPASLIRKPFISLGHDGSDPSLPAPGPDDFVIALGTSEPAGGSEWGEPDLLRQADRGVAWVVSAYNTRPRDLQPNELLIDLWAPVGDCVVDVPHHDAPLGPVTSLIAAAVLETLHAHATEQAVRDQKSEIRSEE